MLRIVKLSINNRLINQVARNYATIIKMPSLSPTMTEGGIVKWYKKEGDEVAAGDLLVDIQTDKAVVGMEVEDDGILAKIIKPNDSQNLKVGVPIGILADTDEDWKNVEIPAEALESADSGSKSKPTETKVESQPSQETDAHEFDEKMGPAVRRLLETYNINPDKITHTGPKSTLLKSDVLKYIEDNKVQPAEIKVEKVASKPAPQPAAQATKSIQADAPYIDIELTNMRQTIAKRMVASKTSAPHFYTTGKARIDNLMKLRKTLKKDSNISASVNDFVIKACAYALRMVPEVNSTVSGPDGVAMNRNVDISVAVATDSGLITPIIFGADHLHLSQIGSKVRKLAEKARDNKLQPNEFMGGTFTISNLGMFGIKEFTAIINAPQTAILAVGAGLPELQSAASDATHVETQAFMRFTLSANARFITPHAASAFLSHVSNYLENPELLITDSSQDQTQIAWGY